MIRWKQAVDKFDDFGMTFRNPDFVRCAEAYGAKATRVLGFGPERPSLYLSTYLLRLLGRNSLALDGWSPKGNALSCRLSSLSALPTISVNRTRIAVHLHGVARRSFKPERSPPLYGPRGGIFHASGPCGAQVDYYQFG